MRKARIMILERHMEPVTRELGRLGLVHLSRTTEEDIPVEQEDVQERSDRCVALQERLRRVLERLDVDVELHPGALRQNDLTLDDIQQLLDQVEEETGRPMRRMETLERAIDDTDEIVRELSPYKNVHVPISRLQESSFLNIKLGTVPPERWGAMLSAMPDGVLAVPLEPEPGAGADEPRPLLAVAGRRRRFAMETVLSEHGFVEEELPVYEEQTPAEVYQGAVEKRRDLRQEMSDLREDLARAGRLREQALQRAAACLDTEARMIDAQAQFGSTWATVVITGWVPAHRTAELHEALEKVTGGQAVMELEEPEPEDVASERVPSTGTRSKMLAPFERLVRGYGTAGYNEIEPSLMFAASFLLLFGIIFGDLGHGLILLGIGLIVRRTAGSHSARDIGYVVAACGLASMLFGTFFQGTFFGIALPELGFPFTLNFEPIHLGGEHAGGTEAVTRYLLLALTVGFGLISLGAVLNILNNLRRRDYMHGIFGRFGIVGLTFYWGAVLLGLKVALAPGPADVWIALSVVVLPLALLVLHEPVHALVTGKRPIWREGPMLGLFSGIVEAMEAVMNYLANTFSFLRVAGFALSHTALAYTIFVLQDLVADYPAGPLWQAAVFVVGTAIIVGLEGLIVTIQVLRLEYYEFFTKFFEGRGMPYEPFRLDGGADSE
jgi:V/A-type H+-transporting ATPase subunit I